MKYPIGLQDFASIINEGFVYVDKTDLIFDLINNYKYVFLSRPRRFGKSLLLSTIRYFFEGRKDLFVSLKINSLEKEWLQHPVFLLALSRVNANSPISLANGLDNEFSIWENQLDISPKNSDLAFRFSNIIRKAATITGRKVVILIDEYDNPLINSIEDQTIYQNNRDLLKSIYSNLKDLDEYIRFALITGVSRFSNVSIFSGLNNVQDISFSDKFSSICGFTIEDINTYLHEGVEEFAESTTTNYEEVFNLLKLEYDGYHFSKNLTDVFNPFSLLNALNNREILNYWIRSGVPGFLINKINSSKKDYQSIFNASADDFSLAESDTSFSKPIALLFQTGYLTIKGYDKVYKEFHLGFPNREVKKGLLMALLDNYSESNTSANARLLRDMAEALLKGEPENFLNILKSVLATISYQLHGKFSELDFERTLFVILHLLGLEVNVEVATSHGRIDMTVKTSQFIYLMEFKLDSSAEAAMKQIIEKEYDLQWRIDHRKIYLIGIGFSSSTRNISDWIIN